MDSQIILYHGDCLEVMKGIPDKSVDLVVADPPYNIKKAAWDKWKKQEDYIKWLGDRFSECERVLKDNGSFYFFHNDFLQMVEIQNWIKKNTRFVFKQLVIWNKKFKGAYQEGFLQGFNEANGLRNYQKMAEYLLFYTFQDETGLTTVMLDTNNFPTLRKYFYDLLCYMGQNTKSIERKLGHRREEHCFYVMPRKRVIEKIGQKADHCFRYGSTQWDMPTRETYQELIDKFHIDKWEGFRPYESQRREYESLRYTFNNQKTHHSIWNYDIAERQGHITPKPAPLIENIIKHSSNENDIVLDPFMGSGTTGVACVKTGRRFIGIELDEGYFSIAKQRIEAEQAQTDLLRTA